jgi:hypothetical protein
VTIASDVIQAAYREGNLVPVGVTPNTNELAEALPLLNRFINGIFGYEMGENLRDWQVPAKQITALADTTYPQAAASNVAVQGVQSQNQLPPKNSRIVFGCVTSTVYFPSNPQDGSRMAVVQGTGAGAAGVNGAVLTLDGNGRFIDGAATATFTAALPAPATPKAWIYRADLGQWKTCVDVVAGDEMPFPKDLDDFFICGLAIRLAPRYTKITAAGTVKTMADTLKRLRARYRQAGTTTYGGENLGETDQSYISGVIWW